MAGQRSPLAKTTVGTPESTNSLPCSGWSARGVTGERAGKHLSLSGHYGVESPFPIRSSVLHCLSRFFSWLWQWHRLQPDGVVPGWWVEGTLLGGFDVFLHVVLGAHHQWPVPHQRSQVAATLVGRATWQCSSEAHVHPLEVRVDLRLDFPRRGVGADCLKSGLVEEQWEGRLGEVVSVVGLLFAHWAEAGIVGGEAVVRIHRMQLVAGQRCREAHRLIVLRRLLGLHLTMAAADKGVRAGVRVVVLGFAAVNGDHAGGVAADGFPIGGVEHVVRIFRVDDVSADLACFVVPCYTAVGLLRAVCGLFTALQQRRRGFPRRWDIPGHFPQFAVTQLMGGLFSDDWLFHSGGGWINNFV